MPAAVRARLLGSVRCGRLQAAVALTSAVFAGRASEPPWFSYQDNGERHIPALLPAAVEVSAAERVRAPACALCFGRPDLLLCLCAEPFWKPVP